MLLRHFSCKGYILKEITKTIRGKDCMVLPVLFPAKKETQCQRIELSEWVEES